MSLPQGLDEISETDLRAELARRQRLQARGLCDYCERGRRSPSCRFPDRHKKRTRSKKKFRPSVPVVDQD